MNRPIHDINDDLLAAGLCVGKLADFTAEHGLRDQVLINFGRCLDGFHRLMIERRAQGG